MYKCDKILLRLLGTKDLAMEPKLCRPFFPSSSLYFADCQRNLTRVALYGVALHWTPLRDDCDSWGGNRSNSFF